MDLIADSDTYEPVINDEGNYVDYLPPSSKFKNGLRCPCGSRREHVFDTRNGFASHIKTKTHIKWLTDLNLNKTNYFVENIKLKDTINNLKMTLARLNKENEDNIKLIAHLTKKIELKENNNLEIDLINFD